MKTKQSVINIKIKQKAKENIWKWGNLKTKQSIHYGAIVRIGFYLYLNKDIFQNIIGSENVYQIENKN